MKNTGLKNLENATVENFTSKVGLKIRKKVNKPWKKILSFGTKKNIILEQQIHLDKDKVYIFACNHSFDEDVISILQSLDRNAYVLNGSTDQTEHNPAFIALWLNGMIYVNRLDSKSRSDSLKKMQRTLQMGTSVMMFPEGGYNNTENHLITPLFPGVYNLSKLENVEVVPVISFNDYDYFTNEFDDNIYLRIGEPIKLYEYSKLEGLSVLRDTMSTMVYDIMEQHNMKLSRKMIETEKDPRKKFMELRKKVYECQDWYNNVWKEELTFYPGHNVTIPEKAFEYAQNVKLNKNNIGIISPILVRNNEFKKYNLVKYLEKNIQLKK